MANNVNAFVPEIYSQRLLKESKEMTDFKNNMTNNDWEGEIKSAGDTVHICTPDLANIVIGEGVVPDTTSVYPKSITLTIDKSKSFQFKFNDIEQAQSQFNMMEGYMSSANESTQDFPGGLGRKESACKARDPDLIPGSGRSPGEGNGNPLQYSCLENPMDRGACGLQFMELQKRHNLATKPPPP